MLGPDIMDGSYAGEKNSLSAWDIFLISSLYNGVTRLAQVGDPSEAFLESNEASGVHVVSVGSSISAK